MQGIVPGCHNVAKLCDQFEHKSATASGSQPKVSRSSTYSGEPQRDGEPTSAGERRPDGAQTLEEEPKNDDERPAKFDYHELREAEVISQKEGVSQFTEDEIDIIRACVTFDEAMRRA